MIRLAQAAPLTPMLLPLGMAVAILTQSILWWPSQPLVGLGAAAFGLILLRFWRRILRSIPLAMALNSLSFGGLGMLLGHHLGHHLSHAPHHHHGAPAVAGWSISGVTLHYLFMLLFCLAACYWISVLQKHTWPTRVCHWRCHIPASLCMLAGMVLLQNAAIWLTTGQLDSAQQPLASLLGMAGGTGLYYWGVTRNGGHTGEPHIAG